MTTDSGPLKIDWVSLAIRDPEFEVLWEGKNRRVDLSDPETNLQLTKSILRTDFDIHVELPADRLCPPVPTRYEYIRWLQGLVDTTSEELTDKYDPDRQVIGIDIGVGASCIYPLLGCAKRPNWRFAGTELDQKNHASATKNVELNKLSSRIRLLKVDDPRTLLPLDRLGIEHADFVMCNPPFYTSRQDMQARLAAKERAPTTICTGADVEMVTEGGDLGFATRILEASLHYRSRVQWYTCLLGKLDLVVPFVGKLKEAGIANWALASLEPGDKTKRRVVGWSFDSLRPRNNIARCHMQTKESIPFPTNLEVTGLEKNDAMIDAALNALLNNLDLRWDWDRPGLSGTLFTRANVWSRAWRRQKRRRAEQGEKPAQTTAAQQADEDADEDADDVLVVRIALRAGKGEVRLRWLRGNDTVMFESLQGMVKRELCKACPRLE